MTGGSHLPSVDGSTGRSTIELPDSNVTNRRPFGFSRALAPADPQPMIAAMAAHLEVDSQ